MERLPTYIFDGLSEKGIHKVPNGALVVVYNYSEKEPVKQTVKIDNGSLGIDSTVADYLSDESLFNPFVTGSNTPLSENKNVLTEDYEIPEGSSAVVATGFTIADDVTLTIPDGSVLTVV